MLQATPRGAGGKTFMRTSRRAGGDGLVKIIAQRLAAFGAVPRREGAAHVFAQTLHPQVVMLNAVLV